MRSREESSCHERHTPPHLRKRKRSHPPGGGPAPGGIRPGRAPGRPSRPGARLALAWADCADWLRSFLHPPGALALGGLLWSLNGTPRGAGWGWIALWITAAGTAAMSLAPFLDPGEPIMANYIPVLSAPLFLGGLESTGM